MTLEPSQAWTQSINMVPFVSTPTSWVLLSVVIITGILLLYCVGLYRKAYNKHIAMVSNKVPTAEHINSASNLQLEEWVAEQNSRNIVYLNIQTNNTNSVENQSENITYKKEISTTKEVKQKNRFDDLVE
jgi:predicted ATP-grasp superfamily ATP-dependent carboligase